MNLIDSLVEIPPDSPEKHRKDIADIYAQALQERRSLDGYGRPHPTPILTQKQILVVLSLSALLGTSVWLWNYSREKNRN
jgi:hypothetical protein